MAERFKTPASVSSVSPRTQGAAGRSAVEEQLRRLFDSDQPEFWLSNGLWSGLELVYFAGFHAWFLLGIELRMRKLVHKYKAKPQEFRAARDRILKRHARKLGLPWTEDSLPATGRTKRLCQRQIQALSDLLPLLKKLFRRPDMASVETVDRKVLRAFKVLASQTPGPRPSSTTRKILRIAGKTESHNRTLTLSQIARAVYPDYTSLPWDMKLRFRQRVSRILKRSGFSHILTRRY